MRFNVILRYMGMVLLLDALFMLVSALISLSSGPDTSFTPLLLSFLLTAIIGFFPLIFVGKTDRINSKEGYAIVVGAWFLSCLVGTFPYLLWGGEFNAVNAWFESVSGFTTTGSTILTDVGQLPRGLLFWRSSTHLLGGAGVVMFALVILPMLGKARSTITSVELSSLAKDNYRYRTQKIIQILMYVYVGMTVAETVLLKLAGMTWFDAVNHSFSTVATGGFSTKTLSIAAYDSVAIEMIITVFMILAGIHFGLIFATFTAKRNNMFRSEVCKYFVGCTLACSLLIAIDLWAKGSYGGFGESLRYGLFQCASIVTTTGFATANTNLWTPFAIVILLFLSVQCGCAGSTSGGIKSDRVLLAFKVVRAQIKQQQHPNAIIRIKLNGVLQDNATISHAMMYVVVYVMLIFVSTIINTLCGLDLLTGFSASIANLSNVGPGFGLIGSMDNFAQMPVVMKFFSTIFMLLGRLEIFGLIQFFLIKWWV